MELIALVFVCWLVTRWKPWSNGPKFRDSFSITRFVSSCLDEGPMKWKPTHKQLADRGNEDPNSNPHYIWNEQGD